MDGGATEILEEGAVADLGSFERWWNDPGIAVWSFVLFGCFLLNATLLLAFLIRPGLRTISNRFVMNLTVSNLLTCTILNPLLIMDALSTPTPTSTSTSAASICAISEGATALVTTSSVLSVLLIAMDQYFAVVDPLRYRARVDKLKSGVLIVSVWFVSAIFGLLASFNPNPRSFWLSCTMQEGYFLHNSSFNSSVDTIVDAELTLPQNETDLENSEMPGLLKTIETIRIDSSIGLLENSTVVFRNLTHDSITYGLIYAVIHSVFAYLLPFAGVCWIYVSIYAAAHKNSERTRRTGSRPILSSASFCEEQYGLPKQQQEFTAEDFRRIPKISSLSSIDETSETTQPASQAPRRQSFSSASEMGFPSATVEEQSSGVVFTVGSQRVEVSPKRSREEENDCNAKVPIATLKAEFLGKEHNDSAAYEDFVRSKFHEQPEQRRKSSHDIMYEDMLSRGNVTDTWIPDGSSDSSSDSEEDEAQFRYLDRLEVPEERSRKCRRDNKYYSPFSTRDSALKDSTKLEIGEDRDGSEKTEQMDKEVEHGTPADVNHLKLELEDHEANQAELCCDLNGETRPSGLVTDSEGSNGSKRDTVAGNVTESSTCLLTPIVTITPAPSKNGTLHRVSSIRSTSSYINSLKHRISNGSLFRYREETRAARISALVIVMGLICWSPYVILLVIKNLPQYSDQNLPHEYDVLALSFLVLAAYISPLLFGYRSRRVKRELRKFFCFKKELSYKNNRSLMAKKVLKRRHSSTLSHLEMDHRYNIFNCVYGRSRWPKEKVQFVQVPDTALAVETCRSSFSSGASTQISSTSTEEC